MEPGLAGLAGVLERVGGRLDGAGRARVLADLRAVAEADGRVTRGEGDLIGLVERVLGADP